MGTQQFCLKWNSHQSNMVTVLDQLLSNEAFVDVTLACEGLSLKAHKIILSSCSSFFQNLFLENPCKHPIVIMKDMKFTELKAVVDFIYKGEVSIAHHQLSGLLKTAEELNIKGLAEVADESRNNNVGKNKQSDSSVHLVNPLHFIPVEKNTQDITFSPINKKKKSRIKRRSSNDSNTSENESLHSKLQPQCSTEMFEEILPESTINSQKQISILNQTEYQVAPNQVPPNQVPNDLQEMCNSVSLSIPQQNTYKNMKEPTLEYEKNYESSNLLEQIMVTGNKTLYQDDNISSDLGEPSSTHILASSRVPNNHLLQVGPSLNDNKTLTSYPPVSEAPALNGISDVPDIKPVLRFDETSSFPVVSYKNNICSSIPSLPGPSNYNSGNPQSELSGKQNESEDECKTHQSLGQLDIVMQNEINQNWIFENTNEDQTNALPKSENFENLLNSPDIMVPSKRKCSNTPNEKLDCMNTNEENYTQYAVRGRGRPIRGRQIKNGGSNKQEKSCNRYKNSTYINYKNQVPVKIFEDFDCHCPMKCRTKLSVEVRRNEFKKFHDLTSFEAQTIYLASHIDEVHKKRSRAINLGSENVCINKKNFMCTICHKTFSQKGYLKTHVRLHTGDKPYLCEVCNKGFAEKGVLKRHLQIHIGEKPFQCSFCQKRFIRKGILNIHMRIHTGEKPYLCGICKKGFADRRNLTAHLRIHTGENPFSCEICDKKFKWSHQLKRHQKRHLIPEWSV